MMRKTVTILTVILIIATMLFACKKKCDCSKAKDQNRAECDCPNTEIPIDTTGGEPPVVVIPGDTTPVNPDDSIKVQPHRVAYSFSPQNKVIFGYSADYWKTLTDSAEVTGVDITAENGQWNTSVSDVVTPLRYIYNSMGANKSKFKGSGNLHYLTVKSAQEKIDSAFAYDVLGYRFVQKPSYDTTINFGPNNMGALTDIALWNRLRDAEEIEKVYYKSSSDSWNNRPISEVAPYFRNLYNHIAPKELKGKGTIKGMKEGTDINSRADLAFMTNALGFKFEVDSNYIVIKNDTTLYFGRFNQSNIGGTATMRYILDMPHIANVYLISDGIPWSNIPASDLLNVKRLMDIWNLDRVRVKCSGPIDGVNCNYPGGDIDSLTLKSIGFTVNPSSGTGMLTPEQQSPPVFFDYYSTSSGIDCQLAEQNIILPARRNLIPRRQ